MLHLNVEIEFADRESAREIQTWVRSIDANLPAGVESVQEVSDPDSLKAFDWHYLEIAIYAVASAAGLGAAKKTGELIAQWLITAIRDRLAGDKKSEQPEAPKSEDTSNGSENRQCVTVSIREIRIQVTPTTPEDELIAFAKSVGQTLE